MIWVLFPTICDIATLLGDSAMTKSLDLVVTLHNPCRVAPGQESYMLLDLPSSKWIPIDSERRAGIVMLQRRSTSSITTTNE